MPDSAIACAPQRRGGRTRGRTRGRSRGRRGHPLRSALLCTATLVLGLLVGAPAHADGPDRWSVTGPDTTLVSSGATSPAAFTYDVADSRRKDAAWLFEARAGTTGRVSLPWSWTGDHGRSQVRSRLDDRRLPRRHASTRSPCSSTTAPATAARRGRADSATRGPPSLDLEQGDRYGFLLTAAHQEKNGPLAGSFALAADPGARPHRHGARRAGHRSRAGRRRAPRSRFSATAEDPVGRTADPDLHAGVGLRSSRSGTPT